jgi:hypothetical protein
MIFLAYLSQDSDIDTVDSTDHDTEISEPNLIGSCDKSDKIKQAEM